ncbi:MAG: cold shock domain-containing protein, partial [Candidatus Paceibacterota bacterium]
MQQGTIVRITDRGFGFIAREGGEKDIFFHSNEL